MKINAFYSLVLSALLATAGINAHAANPCALTPSFQDGIGGTGNSPDSGLESGIGGTGHAPQDGIGGTGHQPQSGVGGTGEKVVDIGGTGQKLAIVGVVTGFASVCVNGEEVHFEDNTTVTVNGEPANTSSLAVGQVVSITADKTPKGWTASSISTNDAVSGPITKFTKPSRVEIAGQTVNLPKELTTGAGNNQFAVGQNVRVQGLRLSNGEILATGATPTNSRAIVISGPVQKLANGSIAIGGVRVGNLTPNLAVAGQHISVTGRMVGATLQATNARRALQIDANAQQLSIQSAVASAHGGRIQLTDGTVINAAQNIKPGSLVHIFAIKDKSGNWQSTQISDQSQADLMRRAGERQNNSGRGKNNSGKDGETNSAEDENSNSGSGSGANSDSSSNSGSDSGSGSGSDSGSGSGSSTGGPSRGPTSLKIKTTRGDKNEDPGIAGEGLCHLGRIDLDRHHPDDLRQPDRTQYGGLDSAGGF